MDLCKKGAEEESYETHRHVLKTSEHSAFPGGKHGSPPVPVYSLVILAAFSGAIQVDFPCASSHSVSGISISE